MIADMYHIDNKSSILRQFVPINKNRFLIDICDHCNVLLHHIWSSDFEFIIMFYVCFLFVFSTGNGPDGDVKDDLDSGDEADGKKIDTEEVLCHLYRSF